MPRGGKRSGAGRKPSPLTKTAKAVTEAIILSGETPLEIMLAAMRKHRDEGRLKEAVAVAVQAAPYCHPRLAAVVVVPPREAEKPKLMLVNGEEPPDANGRAAV
jgi:hypothetical protein